MSNAKIKELEQKLAVAKREEQAKSAKRILEKLRNMEGKIYVKVAAFKCNGVAPCTFKYFKKLEEAKGIYSLQSEIITIGKYNSQISTGQWNALYEWNQYGKCPTIPLETYEEIKRHIQRENQTLLKIQETILYEHNIVN